MLAVAESRLRRAARRGQVAETPSPSIAAVEAAYEEAELVV
jgi:hypothetical protein